MRASERAYASLLDDIQSGRLAPGSVLGEVEQAARLGVSRTPLREAIARLTADGLVKQQSARVTVVAGFDADDIRKLFDVRRALEDAAVRLAAERGDPATFAELADDFAHARLGDAEDHDVYYALIARFDAQLDAAVDNEYLAASLRAVRTQLSRVRALARANPSRLAASVVEHELIATAISEGRGELAAHATQVHLHHALANILDSIGATAVTSDHRPEGPS
ncbi:GntR family transcriptional regulator [Agromyces silvae]|uniref:GntR family transcriptional regulator n=1 Tax=Agromyces silvae TaxID=3388266 RepID=UPI00280BBE71|nr:GntR family transcriptional regulator [Agromyces protaetiae]